MLFATCSLGQLCGEHFWDSVLFLSRSRWYQNSDSTDGVYTWKNLSGFRVASL